MDGVWTTDDRSSGPFCLEWGPWIAYATLARIGWLARQLDSDEDTCTSSSSSLALPVVLRPQSRRTNYGVVIT